MDHRHRHARRRSAEASGTCVCALWRVAGRRESAAQIMSERNAADRQTDPLTVGIICLFLIIRAGGPRLTARMCGGPRAARPGGARGAPAAPAVRVAATRLRVRAAREAPHLMWHTARPHSPRRATGRDTTGISAIRIQTRGTLQTPKAKPRSFPIEDLIHVGYVLLPNRPLWEGVAARRAQIRGDTFVREHRGVERLEPWQGV